MVKAKITITMNVGILKKIDVMVERKVFRNRSKAIQEVIGEKLSLMPKNRLARECNKLDAKFEKALADAWIYSELLEC
jgi:Arc/MetJ-type ribon-helix-helix transcriptional regulator